MLLTLTYVAREGSHPLGEVLDSVSPTVDGIRSWTARKVLCVHINDDMLVIFGPTYLNGARLRRLLSMSVRVRVWKLVEQVARQSSGSRCYAVGLVYDVLLGCQGHVTLNDELRDG